MHKPTSLPIRRALISVSDKRGIIEFARELQQMGVQILSTGGTAKSLREAGIAVTSVSDVTGFPEILDGRVKTLHPAIHAGLLALLDNPEHEAQLREHRIQPIDLLVVNLYPFEETIRKPSVALEEAIEQIDIGGPAMVRAAAKNYRFTAVVVSPERYASILNELRSNNGTISASTRFSLASEAFVHTAHYDTMIASYLVGRVEPSRLPTVFTQTLRKDFDLRYGENPHQAAAFYGEFSKYYEKLHGKELSFNNILDLNAAVNLCDEFEEPTVVIIKHNNPCGVGSASRLAEAYGKALATDPKSAFGGIIAFNREVDMATASAVHELFSEILVAPGFSAEALALLQKKRDRRLIRQIQEKDETGLDVRSVIGGYLVQEPDAQRVDPKSVRVVTKRQPTDDELHAMLFAWRVAKHVKSNAMVYARTDRTLGIGAGQMSRVDSARIAVMKAQEAGLDLNGCAVASDAFFPFADGLMEAVKAGATAVIQPGGSVRDEEVIKAADEHGVAMVFTGVRYFRH